MPEIVDIRKYLARYAKLLEARHRLHALPPLSSLIDLPKRADWNFFPPSPNAGWKNRAGVLLDTIEGVEYYYITKKGKNVNLLLRRTSPSSGHSGPVQPPRSAQGSKKTTEFPVQNLPNPQHARRLAMVHRNGKHFRTVSYGIFHLVQGRQPRNTPFFGQDIHRHLKSIAEKIQIETEANTMGTNTHAALPASTGTSVSHQRHGALSGSSLSRN
jgi:hypothetical protein